MRLELQITLLMFLALGALALNHFVPRTEAVQFTSEDWEFVEAHNGLGSQASTKVTERGAEMQMQLVDRGSNPFIAAIFRCSNREDTVDFSWFSQIKLRAYIVGEEEEYFRLFIRTRIPELYDSSAEISRQYNEIAFKVTDEPQTFVFGRERFHVPSWWAETIGSKAEHSIPVFDRVDSIEVNTGSSVREASLTLVVEEIELCGHWFPPIVLYRTLLSTWLLLALSVVIKKSFQLRKTVRQSQERESRLKLINSALASEKTELAKMAHHDSLTGLLNRHGFKSDPRLKIEGLIEHDPVSLIIFDIDYFKKVNDVRGHNFGDQVLADVGELLTKAVGQNQSVARWGGEEFIVACFEENESDACEFADTLREIVETKIGITCSFGVSEVREGESFVDALDRADRAMYQAKSSGRNRVVGFSQMEKANETTDDRSAVSLAD